MVESDIISQIGKFVLLANLLERFLILRSESSLINSSLPAKVAFVGLLHLLHVFRALNVDGGLRLNPKNPGGFCLGGVTREGFVDRSPAKSQILLKLVRGNKLGSPHRIKSAGSFI